ncbi:hypothetical protein HK099_000604, partial [Clydaea vesicula]
VKQSKIGKFFPVGPQNYNVNARYFSSQTINVSVESNLTNFNQNHPTSNKHQIEKEFSNLMLAGFAKKRETINFFVENERKLSYDLILEFFQYLIRFNLEKELKQCFGMINNPTIVMYTKILSLLSKKKDVEWFMYYFKKLKLEKNFKPDVYTYNIVLNFFGHLRDETRVKYYYNEMQNLKISPNIYTFNNLINFCSEIQNFSKVKYFFNKILENELTPNIITMNSMLKAVAREKDLVRVEYYFDKIKKFGLNPDKISYTIVLKAYLDKGLLDKVHKYLNLMKEEGSLDTVVYNILMQKKLDSGDAERVEIFFKELQSKNLEPDVITYTTLMSSLVDLGRSEEVESYYKEMVSKNIEPNLQAYTILIKSFFMLENSEKVEHYFKEFISKGLQADAVIYSYLVSTFAQSNNEFKLSYYFNEMINKNLKPDMKTLNTYVLNGTQHDYNKIFEKIKKLDFLNFQLDITTWSGIMNAYNHSRDSDTAIRIYETLTGTLGKRSPAILPIKIERIPYDLKTAGLFAIGLDVCKHGGLRDKYHDIWLDALNSRIPLNANVLTSYIECMCRFDLFEKALFLLRNLMSSKCKDQRIPKPDEKTISTFLKILDKSSKFRLKKMFKLVLQGNFKMIPKKVEYKKREKKIKEDKI